ncbi:arfaptin-2 isoform X1 [Lepeophtheirus salmonis]|uniref:arfaptin-2 isoform X1 n=1 Tax=Lepeophtheirus salmonis TaxID=72036 RepID=UPI001AE4D848|nr:arfaptin-2-like isoform X1 [Lepeophtheirus salmonis]XP_040564599.1 arfaptin-2-like isoform X1 [Lepeophtheirus salmonis]XP_040564600.1 arfaptin-2-like isoform X1 [Lepeophtheirus salmonis]XP_040564601.1 arfaptin-2-like isoform X1 [Lepeophtheirus salmonis]
MANMSASNPIQEILKDEDCEEINPLSSSVNSGRRATPPNSLPVVPPGDEKGIAVTFLNNSDSCGSSTSWSGGMSIGCTTVLKSAAGDIAAATTNIPLNSPSPCSLSANGTPTRGSNRLEYLKNWTISTYKCSRQTIYEKLGKSSRTIDSEMEGQIEALRDTQRKYGNILRLARALSSHFGNVVQTQSSLGECFNDLSNRSPELQKEFKQNADTQKKLRKNGEALLSALNFFVSSVNTLCNKTMEDTITTVKHYESARIEYDAYRSDLEFFSSAPKTESNAVKLIEMEGIFNKARVDFEKLRSDVQIKLKFLNENRVKVMHKQLTLFHNAITAYFTGNQNALEATLKQFSIKAKGPEITSPSWMEK